MPPKKANASPPTAAAKGKGKKKDDSSFLGTLIGVIVKVTLFFAFVLGCCIIYVFFVMQMRIPPDHFKAGSTIHVGGLSSGSLVTGDSVKLNYVSVGPQNGKLVIFLHGFPETALLSWHHQLDFFGKDGRYFVVAPDMRGYNQSGKPEGLSNYAPPRLAQDVVDVISHFGRQDAILVGHDWGAAVAWATAINHPDKISKLAILNVPHTAAMQKYLYTTPSQLRKSWYIFYFQLPFLPEIRFTMDDFLFPIASLATSKKGTFGVDDIEEYKKVWSIPGEVTSTINYYRAAIRSNFLGRTNVEHKVEPKTLIIWGNRDAFLEAGMAELSLAFCRDATLKFVEASHWVQHEEPATVNKYLQEFFDN